MITGMSGAGRSEAGNSLEDLGWFVMDNLPPALIGEVASAADRMGPAGERLALVVGNGRYHEEIAPLIEELRTQADRLRLVFLDASTDVLVRRYESTRRRHPFAAAEGTPRLSEAIEVERSELKSLRSLADLMIDTSDFNVHQLRARMFESFNGDGSVMQTNIVSFGYKHGLPRDVDLVFDCRFLPNPYWVPDLRPLTGFDQAVADYVLQQRIAEEFLSRLEGLLNLVLPGYVQEGRTFLSVAFGCTGGRHRSVAIAERMAATLRRMGRDPTVSHRDVHR